MRETWRHGAAWSGKSPRAWGQVSPRGSLHYWACALKLWAAPAEPHARTTGRAPSAHALRREKPLPPEAWASHREKSSHSNKDVAQPEINKRIKFLKKSIKKILLKTELLCDPAIPLQGIYPEKNMVSKDTRTSKFIAALFTTANPWKGPKYPLAEEQIKMWHIDSVEHYSALRRENKAICSNMMN